MTNGSIDKFQKAGDECQSCYKFWVHQGEKPRRLVAVNNKTTENQSIEIAVCPFCDGDTILRLNGG